MLNDTTDVEEELTLTRDEAVLVRRWAAEQDATYQEVDDFDPGTVTVLIIATVAAYGIIERALNVHRGGQVIDARPDAPRLTYRDKDLEYGFVVVRAADGGVAVSTDGSKDTLEQVIGLLRKMVPTLGGKPAAEMAADVEAAVGAGGSVSVLPG